MIFSARAEIANYIELDVQCDQCGRAYTIPCPDGPACDRLIDGYYFHEATVELELLSRAERLFDSRPRSNHRYVVQKEYRDRVSNAEDSSLLQELINADPSLKEFLNSWFSFHPRKRGVESSLAELRDRMGAHITPCPNCLEPLRLTEESHDACGGVFFSEEARLRWIARHVLWSRETRR